MKNAKSNGWLGYLQSHPFLLFFLLFFVYLFILQLITHLPWFTQPLSWLTTTITSTILKWIGLPVSMEGCFIVSARGINMEIIYECTGIYGIIVYVSAVLASDRGWYRKLYGILLGVPLIWLTNLIRLISIYWISYEYPPIFDFLHTYFWQLFLIIVVIIVFYSWYRLDDTNEHLKNKTK